MVVLVPLIGCHDHGDHVHDEDIVDGEHHERDLATEPCDPSNWRELFPDLRECELPSGLLNGESLRRADLSRANLQGARLEAADMFKAVLVDAALSGAFLERANLTSVDLRNADLTGASLRGATLTNAQLGDATLDDAATDATTRCPSGLLGPCW